MNRITLLTIFAILEFAQSSYGANRYVENGIPSPSHEWYGQEYARAAELLTRETLALPIYDGADGEKVFLRMISADNFSFARNRTIPLAQRMENFLTMQQAVNSITKKYALEANRGAKLNREICEQLAFSLRMCTVMFELVDEFLPTIKKDEKYEVRVDGLRKIKMSMETVFSVAEQSLGERSFYTDADIAIILTAMAETLPPFNAVFSEDYRAELRGRLEKRTAEFQSKEMVRTIESMRTELANSKSPAGTKPAM